MQRTDVHGLTLPNSQPALGVPIERRPADRPLRRHPVPDHGRGRRCPAGRRGPRPSASGACATKRAARSPGMVAVGSIRTPVTSPSNSTVSSTTASPWTWPRFVRRQPGARLGDHRAGLVADQRHPRGRAGAGAPAVPRRPHVSDLHVQPVGAQQPGQHSSQVGVRTHHNNAAAFGDASSGDGGQTPQRSRHPPAAEQQHPDVRCGQSELLAGRLG